jgi:hypothetical protein
MAKKARGATPKAGKAAVKRIGKVLETAGKKMQAAKGPKVIAVARPARPPALGLRQAVGPIGGAGIPPPRPPPRPMVPPMRPPVMGPRPMGPPPGAPVGPMGGPPGGSPMGPPLPQPGPAPGAVNPLAMMARRRGMVGR